MSFYVSYVPYMYDDEGRRFKIFNGVIEPGIGVLVAASLLVSLLL